MSLSNLISPMLISLSMRIRILGMQIIKLSSNSRIISSIRNKKTRVPIILCARFPLESRLT